MQKCLFARASLLVVAGFALTPAFSQPDAVTVPTDTTATVASWNIKGFGGITSDEKIERLAEGIVALDAEVVALQEVNPDSVAGRIVEEANERGARYANPVILEQAHDLNLAILHKQGLSVSNPRFIAGSNLGSDELRQALVADVEIGEFDFTLIVVHLKSGRDGSDRDIRTQQAQVIAGFIAQSTAAGEDDVLVAGDYNMIPDDDWENFLALNPSGFLRFISTHEPLRDFTNVNGNFLDGFAISRRRMTEYVEGSFHVYPLHRVYHRTMIWYDDKVSDHFPLEARFDITRDRD